MTNYQIYTDCTCDLSKDIYMNYPLIIFPMDVTIDSSTFSHTHDFKNMSAKEFYEKLKNGSMSTTSQITPMVFKEIFEYSLKEGKDVLYIGFSSGLSGTLQSSLVAKSELEDLYPNNKIVIIDSLATITDSTNQVIFISHGDAFEDAQFLADKIFETSHVKEIVISDIGPVIGSHSGPGTIALFFFATER